MKNNNSSKKGFTLIELLVVVLIIGILAAVALPQYQKAVIKTRLTQLDTMINAAKKGVDLYLLSEGYPASDSVTLAPGDLDTEVPGEYSDEWYRTRVGGVHIEVGNDRSLIGYDSFKGPSGTEPVLDILLTLQQDKGKQEWYVELVASEASGDEDLTAVCQYLKARNYRASAPEDCAAVGVTLPQYSD